LISGKFKRVTIGEQGQMYAIALSGEVKMRAGLTDNNKEIGTGWTSLTNSGTSFKHVDAGFMELWAINNFNEVYKRAGINEA
jgi:hypothetical protein